MKNLSLTKSLPALLALTGGAIATSGGEARAVNTGDPPPESLDALETRVKNVQEKLSRQQPGVSFAERTTEDGLQTFWWGNWHNGGWGPGMWHNWGNGGWRNWGNGWGNGGWHNWPNWHNWHNWGNW